MDAMTDLLTLGQDFLGRQPFSQLLEAELLEMDQGRAVIHVPIRPDSYQQHGFVHGGLISYLADNALTFAGGSMYGDAVTVEFKINYLRPATGTALRATAVVENAGRSQAVVRCTVESIQDDTTKTVAVAQGTIARK